MTIRQNSCNRKKSVIRKSRLEDLHAIRQWLEDEKARGIHGNFLCNWSIIEQAHTNQELLVYIDGGSDLPVAFQLGRLLQSGILQVKSEFRGQGIGKKMVEYCVNLARRKDECLLSIQCKPSTSIAFWERMGFALAQGNQDSNNAYRILDKPLSLPMNGVPTKVTIRFFPEERNWNEATRPCSEAIVSAKLLNTGVIKLGRRVLHHDCAFPSIRDVVVEIVHDGIQLLLAKAKYDEAKTRGVFRCKNGWYLDEVLPR